MTLAKYLAQECQQKPHLCLQWLQGGPHHFPTSQNFPPHPSGNPPQLMNTSKFCEHFRFLWTPSRLSHITHTASEHHRSRVTLREHSVEMVQYIVLEWFRAVAGPLPQLSKCIRLPGLTHNAAIWWSSPMVIQNTQLYFFDTRRFLIGSFFTHFRNRNCPPLQQRSCGWHFWLPWIVHEWP